MEKATSRQGDQTAIITDGPLPQAQRAWEKGVGGVRAEKRSPRYSDEMLKERSRDARKI